jgi:hypothetical protein
MSKRNQLTRKGGTWPKRQAEDGNNVLDAVLSYRGIARARTAYRSSAYALPFPRLLSAVPTPTTYRSYAYHLPFQHLRNSEV